MRRPATRSARMPSLDFLNEAFNRSSRVNVRSGGTMLGNTDSAVTLGSAELRIFPVASVAANAT